MESATFHVVYRSFKALSRDCEQQIKMHGLLLRVDVDAERLSPVVVRIQLPDGDKLDLRGQVVQVISGQGIAVQFLPESDKAIESLVAKASSGVTRDQTSEESDPEFFAPGSTPPSMAKDRLAKSKNLQDQISEMSVAQKRNSALHGRKDMRMLLIRDRNKTIHPFVIKNPAITLDEIEQIAKMPSVNPDVLRTIAKSREWNRSVVVCRNLVRNPKTPLKEALMLLGKLPISDVRALAKSSNVRTPIQQAARKKVVG